MRAVCRRGGAGRGGRRAPTNDDRPALDAGPAPQPTGATGPCQASAAGGVSFAEAAPPAAWAPLALAPAPFAAFSPEGGRASRASESSDAMAMATATATAATCASAGTPRTADAAAASPAKGALASPGPCSAFRSTVASTRSVPPPPPNRLSSGNPEPRGAGRRAPEPPWSDLLEIVFENTAASSSAVSENALAAAPAGLAETAGLLAPPSIAADFNATKTSAASSESAPADPRRLAPACPSASSPASASISLAARAASAAAERPSPSRSTSDTGPVNLARRAARFQRLWLSASSSGVKMLTSGLSGRGVPSAGRSKKEASATPAARHALLRLQGRRMRLRAMAAAPLSRTRGRARGHSRSAAPERAFGS